MISKELTNAVIEQLGGGDEVKTQMEDITNHGISGGFGGFIYFTDTVKFYQDNKAEIDSLVKDMSEEFGEDVITFVAGFGCLDDDRDTRDAIGATIYGRKQDANEYVANALAWFAGEEVARQETDS